MREAREFASDELQLPDNRSYRTYADIHRPYVVWNVVATPEFSVAPQALVLPGRRLRGLSRLLQRAQGARVRGTAWRKQGYRRHRRWRARLFDPGEVRRSGVEHHDALRDRTSWRRSIFHELAHQLLYVKNDTEFNEAFATTVEEEGLRRWLALRVALIDARLHARQRPGPGLHRVIRCGAGTARAAVFIRSARETLVRESGSC